MNSRPRNTVRFQLPEIDAIHFKNFTILQKFLTERGKLIPRRITGLSAKGQRRLTEAVKQARFLALLSGGGAR
ncbi:MAG: 30S ribosomal protein S18 [Candidatus Omnitrophica bacterium]|nr:30S ribosomal protein S18 [Candidatus Omnitrophota bacterium]